MHVFIPHFPKTDKVRIPERLNHSLTVVYVRMTLTHLANPPYTLEISIQPSQRKLNPSQSRLLYLSFCCFVKVVSWNFWPSNPSKLQPRRIFHEEKFTSISPTGLVCSPAYHTTGRLFLLIAPIRKIQWVTQSRDKKKTTWPRLYSFYSSKNVRPWVIFHLHRLTSSSRIWNFPHPGTLLFSIPKRGDLSDPNSYHSIHLTFAISKVTGCNWW